MGGSNSVVRVNATETLASATVVTSASDGPPKDGGAGDAASSSLDVSPSAGGELWTKAALGGTERVEALRTLFSDLRAHGVILSVITKGYVGAVKQLLKAEDLLDNFDAVIGNIGKAYATEAAGGETEFDKIEREASPFEGNADCNLVVSKADFIKSLLKLDGLKG